ncbi:MAG: hypothetical protein EBZ50_15505, partial [Alphaproteobacteria bacterium]|nr:hypothetical protein [Alphaproteobacteria bacterium]
QEVRMAIVNMLEAKTHLSRLVAFDPAPSHGRIGALKGCYETPEPDHDLDAAAAALLRGGE